MNGVLQLKYYDGASLIYRSIQGYISYDFSRVESHTLGSFRIYGYDKSDKKVLEFILEKFENFNPKKMTFEMRCPVGANENAVVESLIRILAEMYTQYLLIQRGSDLEEPLSKVISQDIKNKVGQCIAHYEMKQQVAEKMQRNLEDGKL